MKRITCAECGLHLVLEDIRSELVKSPNAAYSCPGRTCTRSWSRTAVAGLLNRVGLPPLATPLPDEDDSLDEWFSDHHNASPHVYEAFKAMAYEIRALGHERYGAKTIMERLRWESPVRYPGLEFKLSNTIKDRCSARYVRLLIVEDPSFRDFFAVRELSTPEQRARLSESHKKHSSEVELSL